MVPAVRTARLLLRRPTADDLDAIFAYASDPEVTRYMAWPRHTTRDTTRGFLDHAAAEWETHGIGSLLITLDGAVIGSTGLHLDEEGLAATGYVLARAAWGHGYATEACRAMVALAPSHGVLQLQAECHTAHAASARVLEKSGFTLEGTQPASTVFPNLGPALLDTLLYTITY